MIALASSEKLCGAFRGPIRYVDPICDWRLVRSSIYVIGLVHGSITVRCRSYNDGWPCGFGTASSLPSIRSQLRSFISSQTHTQRSEENCLAFPARHNLFFGVYVVLCARMAQIDTMSRKKSKFSRSP